MTGEYPDHETYRALYARYYSGRDVRELLNLTEPLSGARVLDLCAGEGQLTLGALAAGARFVLVVDKEPAMIPDAVWWKEEVRVFPGSVLQSLSAIRRLYQEFDCIVCRQAVNYWLNEETAELAARVLVPGGILAFNTFNQKPPEKPRVLEYQLEGHSFVETSWLVGDMVHHVQVRDGMAPHTTSFRWISPEEFRTLLNPYFTVQEDGWGKTSLYRCIRK